MKLNNRGMAISGILYSMLVLFLVLLFGILSIVTSSKYTYDNLKIQIVNKLNGITAVEYGTSSIGYYTDKLLRNNTKYGNYIYMGGTYLRGMQDSNYLWYSGNLYRIMGYDENNNVRLISEGNITAIPYGSKEDGSNVFSTSYLKDWLNTYFYNHIDNSILQNTSYCTDLTNDTLSLRMTCINRVTDTKVTTISLDEYRLAAKPIEYACNDIGYILCQWDFHIAMTQTDFQNYLTSQSKTCMSYVKDIVNSYSLYGIMAGYDDANAKVYINLSYLDDSNFDVFWTLTPYSSSNAWRVDSIGIAFRGDNVSNANGVRPVITISSNVTITGGNGTLASPIMIEETNSKSGKLMDNAVSGQYVKMEDKLYRIVDKVDGAGTKLALDGYLTTKDTYTNMITPTVNIGYLEELGLTVDDSRLVNYHWDWGNCFTDGNSYKLSLASSLNTFQSKVGGIRIGEMYSSQSNSIALLKRVWYWTLTPYESSVAWGVYSGGRADYNFVSSASGVRPVIMISPNVTITGGNGTLDSPYEI